MLCNSSGFSINPTNPTVNEDLTIQNNYLFHPGEHTIQSPVIGSRAEELQAVKAAVETHPILFLLEKAIYVNKLIYLISLDKKDEADAAARHLFLEYRV
jgi:hypothetical protein